MNVKTTVVLLILLILCVGYMLFFHTGWFGKNGKPDETGESDKHLTGQVGEVQKLVLERSGGEKIVFTRRDGKWHIAEPIDAPATDWTVDAIVMSITNLRYVHKYAEDNPECPKDDLTYLSAPQQTVTFTDDKGGTFTIKIGRPPPPPPGGRTYVQLVGDKHVYVVDADLQAVLDKTLADYRLKYVARFDSDRAERITVRGDENYRIVKVDDKWSIDLPVQTRADREKVDLLLQAVSDIHADEFIDDNPKNLAPYGLDKPRLVVTVELPPPPVKPPATAPATRPKPKVISVAFGAGADKKVFAKLDDQPWVFGVAEADLKDLQPKLADLREKNVMDAAGREITKVEISLLSGGSATLEKDKGKWRMLSPFKGGCENSAVHNLLITLQSLKASEFRDNLTTLAAFGLEPPQGKITLHFRGSGKTETLLLGRISDSGQMAFVMPTGSKSVAIISSADMAKLTKPSPAYWNKTISKLPDDATVTSIELDRPDGKFTLAKSDGEYKLTTPVKAKTDTRNVDALLKAIRNIRAERIVALNKTLPKRFAQAKGIRVGILYRRAVPATQPATTSAPATQTSQPTTQPVRPDIHIQQAPFVVIKDKGKSYIWKERTLSLSDLDTSGGKAPSLVIRPIVVGELPGTFYDKLAAEMRDRTVLKIDAEKIISLKMKLGKKSMEFVRSGKVWRYKADRFVKIDASKIEKFLTGLAEIKAKRFVDYSDKPKLNRFGLDSPAMILTLKTSKGREISLKIARTGPVGTRGLYAVSSEATGVFVLAPETSVKMSKSLKDFQKKDGSR